MRLEDWRCSWVLEVGTQCFAKNRQFSLRKALCHSALLRGTLCYSFEAKGK